MIKFAELQAASSRALTEALAKSSYEHKLINVYDHTDEIFDDNFEGVSVYCDVDFKALSWFDGIPDFIISYSYELEEGSIDIFLGDRCTDIDAATAAAERLANTGAWHIEDLDDFLMLQATFRLKAPDELEEKLIKKLKALEDVDFIQAIRPVVNYFE
jgi:hypothetical protein